MKAAWLVRSLMPVALSLAFPSFAQTVSVSVPGAANPYLSGMPEGSTAPPSDSAPMQSPVEVSGLNLGAGGVLQFIGVNGGISRGPGCMGNCNPLDGNEFWNHTSGSQNGISEIRAPIESLVGVFLTDNPPNLSTPPARLDFQALGLEFASLSPELQQVFFIGDGRTSSGAVQEFSVPAQATRFFLGTMDGYEWSNNSGAFNVEVAQIVPEVPEPETYAMLLAGLGLLWVVARRRVQEAAC